MTFPEVYQHRRIWKINWVMNLSCEVVLFEIESHYVAQVGHKLTEVQLPYLASAGIEGTHHYAPPGSSLPLFICLFVYYFWGRVSCCTLESAILGLSASPVLGLQVWATMRGHTQFLSWTFHFSLHLTIVSPTDTRVKQSWERWESKDRVGVLTEKHRFDFEELFFNAIWLFSSLRQGLIYPRMASNSLCNVGWPYISDLSFHLLNAGIIGVQHHVQCMEYWRSKPGLHACYASHTFYQMTYIPRPWPWTLTKYF